jgi:hypothetical protein
MLWAELLTYAMVAITHAQLTDGVDSYDLGQALVFGRPPAITRTYYDVQPSSNEKVTPESECR